MKANSESFATLLICFKLITLVSLPFHTNFRISLWISTKNIDWFSNIEPIHISWDKSHLVKINYLSYTLYIQLVNILLRAFVSMFMRNTSWHFSYKTLVCFWCWNDVGHIKWSDKCILFYFLELTVYICYYFFLIYWVACTDKTTWAWSSFWMELNFLTK